jgi:hypothetical protein
VELLWGTSFHLPTRSVIKGKRYYKNRLCLEICGNFLSSGNREEEEEEEEERRFLKPPWQRLPAVQTDP